MKGSLMKTAKLYGRGFENDRRYMLIDANNTFVSQRNHPILTQVTPVVEGNKITVKSKKDSFSFSLDQHTSKVVDISLFENIIQGTLVSDEVDVRFSEIIGTSVRLVKMMESDVRNKKLIRGPESTEVSFADGYPYLIAGTASLDNLNGRLDEPVLMDRFRPNIVVETKMAHEEDTWETIRIGNAEMMVIKPCARCQVVTIDQESGERAKEPLKTLAKYRKISNKVYFGANAISLRDGTISIGDEVVSL